MSSILRIKKFPGIIQDVHEGIWFRIQTSSSLSPLPFQEVNPEGDRVTGWWCWGPAVTSSVDSREWSAGNDMLWHAADEYIKYYLHQFDLNIDILLEILFFLRLRNISTFPEHFWWQNCFNISDKSRLD